MIHMKRIRLRPMEISDDEYLLDLFIDIRRLEWDLLPLDSHQKRSLFETQKAAQLAFFKESFPNTRFQIILFGKKSIGRLFTSTSEESTRVLDIGIHSRYRRSGIGSFLLKQYIEKCHASGKTVHLNVEKHNPAFTLYKKLGFQAISQDDMSYEMNYAPKSINRGN